MSGDPSNSRSQEGNTVPSQVGGASSSWVRPGHPKMLTVLTEHPIINDELCYPLLNGNRLGNGRRWPLRGQVSIDDYKALHPLSMFHFNIARYWSEKTLSESHNISSLIRFAFEAERSSDVAPLLGLDIKLQSRDETQDKDRLRDSAVGQKLAFTKEQFERLDKREAVLPIGSQVQNHIFIALGSNEGDSIALIEKACRKLDENRIGVLRTSALYESRPMYYEKQGNFLNAVLEARTIASPKELLECLKRIEHELGRVKTIENGPRTIDLDILLYNDQEIESETLQVPHPRMMEREFVLRPLCDLIPSTPTTTSDPLQTFRDQLRRLPLKGPEIKPQTLLSRRSPPIQSLDPAKPTRIMSVLNMTPDSFSDGGLHSQSDPQRLAANLRQQLQHKIPPSILDVGGQSTRPRAQPISPEDEAARILPLIEAIRADLAFDNVAISVDTYRASVAKAAIEAGADLVNDVSAGQMDAEMLKTVGELGCSYIMGHMRGTPETMTKQTDYPNGVISDVGAEMLLRIEEAEKAGIRRWRIILDPGLGFAKTQSQNLEILRRFDDLRNIERLQGLPWVVGASRKGFIGRITGVEEADQRHFGTAACVTAAVKGGADIVRVHDVREMAQVVAMADAIWRSSP